MDVDPNAFNQYRRGSSSSSSNSDYYSLPSTGSATASDLRRGTLPSSRGSILADRFMANVNITPVQSAKAISVVPDYVEKDEEKKARIDLLNKARREYEKKMTSRIFKRKQLVKELQQDAKQGKPKIYNAIESRRDKIMNSMYLYPDTDPAEFTRQIKYPNNISTHAPVFGF